MLFELSRVRMSRARHFVYQLRLLESWHGVIFVCVDVSSEIHSFAQSYSWWR